MQVWVQRIAVYVILVTVLRSLSGKAQYQQYFRFVSGLVLILLLVTPLFRFFGGDVDLYDAIASCISMQDMEEIGERMQAAQGKMQEMIRAEYEKTVRSRVEMIAQEMNLRIQDLSVQIGEDGSLLGMEVHLETGKAPPTKAVLSHFRQRLADSFGIGEESVVLWI